MNSCDLKTHKSAGLKWYLDFLKFWATLKSMNNMIYTRISDVCFPKPEMKDEFIKKKTKYDYLNVIEID